jgi:DNA-binding PucR family transcriptional regulator
MLLGISRSFSDVSEIRKFYLQSTKAIELGLRLSPRDTFFWYEDYNFYQLFEAASKAEEIDDFCKPVLWKIREYDQIHNTSHLDELEAYISADNDRLKSAQILHVHRNTMDYRINKINELFEIDVDDPEMKFSLNLSFRILRFLQSFKDLR